MNMQTVSSNNLTKFPLAIVLAERDGRVLPDVDDVAVEACVDVVIVVASTPESRSVKIERTRNN